MRSTSTSGVRFITKEVFDLLYPSYGDTAHVPRRRGHDLRTRRWTRGGAVETAIGDTLTLGYRIQNHMESGLSTIESAGQHVDRMLKEFAAYHRRNAEMPWATTKRTSSRRPTAPPS